MRGISATWLVRAFAGISLAILLNAPNSAKAGCEHPSDRPAVGLDGTWLEPRQGEQTPPPKPCSGPSCSNKSAPPMTPATLAPPRSELSFMIVEPAPVLPLGASCGMPEGAPDWSLLLATSIFHPPRLPR